MKRYRGKALKIIKDGGNIEKEGKRVGENGDEDRSEKVGA
jgi:hypothetical protein